MFKEYTSKPIIRFAMQITKDHLVAKIAGKEATYFVDSLYKDNEIIEFKAYEIPVVGDWIVRLSEEDTYHVTDKVFRERNIVLDGE